MKGALGKEDMPFFQAVSENFSPQDGMVSSFPIAV